MALHKLDVVKITSPALTLSQIKDNQISTGSEMLKEFLAGHTSPQQVGIKSQKPVLDFTTTQLASIVGSIGVKGVAFTTLDGWLKKMSTVDALARTDTGHTKRTFAEGLIFWESITLRHNEPGEARIKVISRYDGTNDPMTEATAALPGNLTVNGFFGAGKASINGTDLGEIQEITITSNLQAFQEGGKSSVWDTIVAMRQVEPVITVKSLDKISLGTVDLDGLALNGSAGLTFFMRKFKDGGARVADATTEHIKVVAANGTAVSDDIQGQGNELVTDTISVHVKSNNDTDAGIAFTTDSAIT